MLEKFTVRFPEKHDEAKLGYRLIELPPNLLNLFESGELPPGALTIKGRAGDDAVLCTANATYSIRSIDMSNSFAVLTGSHHLTTENDRVLVIREQLHEVLELVPSMPKLERLHNLLSGLEWTGDDAAINDYMDMDEPATKPQPITYSQAQALVQASQKEFDDGLRMNRVVVFDGFLRTVSISKLAEILLLILNVLVVKDYPLAMVPVSDVSSAVSVEHNVPPDITPQFMAWFGQIDRNSWWEVDLPGVVRAIGISILSTYKDEPVAEDAFMENWREAVGDSFQDAVSLSLLSGNYLSSATDPTSPQSNTPTLRYFPSSGLSPTAASRFSDLFLTRTMWRVDVITPFLDDISVDKKERDKLLLKFCRSTTDENGQLWYTSRARY